MIRQVITRLGSTLLTLFLASIVIFIVIQLPPGDYAEQYAYHMQESGVILTENDIQEMRVYYGLDRPMPEQYISWITDIVLHGNFGVSFEFNRPVLEVLGERMGATSLLLLVTLIITYGLAIPIGIITAVRQYSFADYFFSTFAYIGLAIPNFLLALILLYINVVYFGASVGGLFSAEYIDAAWSLGRILDLLRHLWIPSLILGIGGTALQMRALRALLLDEKNKLYVTAARARGLSEPHLLLKYPVRVAINPLVSTLGWELSRVISGAPIVAIVLALPDTGTIFYNSLLAEDMYLAGAMLMLMTVLTLLGTLISDLLLALLDPRIRQGAATQ
jgi:peptide/nickel transport system permease protein